MEVAPWIWALFAAGVVAVLLVDLLVFHRRAQEVSLREAGVWTAVWLALALAFAGVVWAWRGGDAGTEYLTGYLIERSLSVDNVFVLAVIFAYFAVPSAYRHRALLWGVLGALVLRCVFIAGGAVALERVAWTVYVLGAFLIATGLRLAVREVEAQPDRNLVVRLLRRVVPMSERFHGQRFFVRLEQKVVATPMLAVLVAVATTDVAFAADSVPATFAVTDDPFLVFAANAFSVLGMLALYFLLAGMMGRFRYLRPALAMILVLVGAKMAGSEFVHVPVLLSLAVIVSILAVAVALSLRREELRTAADTPAAFGASPIPKPFPRPPSRHQEVSSMLDLFHTIVVGVDGTQESLAALTRARRLLAPGGRLVAVTICEERLAVHAGYDAARISGELHAAASETQMQAAALLADLPRAETRLAHGRPSECLLTVAREVEADLVAVGSHDHSRAAGIFVGSVASEILHRAAQSVLVARGEPDRYRTIVAGVDRSPQSLTALEIARALATSEMIPLRVLAAEGGKGLDPHALSEGGEPERTQAHPVAALVGAAAETDLVIIGSRGLHGLKSLGSVSERVAHRAPCSVLVVRGAPTATQATTAEVVMTA